MCDLETTKILDKQKTGTNLSYYSNYIIFKNKNEITANMKAIIIGLFIVTMLLASGCNLTGGASTEIDQCSSIEESTLKDDSYL